MWADYAMALQLIIQALAASPRNIPVRPPSNGHQQPQKPTTASRRTAAAVSTSLLASQLLPTTASAGTFDLRITIPEKSSEEAEAEVKTHARNLVRVKEFIDAGAWRELQAALRASASNLKQDLYAIIQSRPPSQRPELRRLYSDLFNSVTSLDYAARDKDELQVQKHYGNIVDTLGEIFAKIL